MMQMFQNLKCTKRSDGTLWAFIILGATNQMSLRDKGKDVDDLRMKEIFKLESVPSGRMAGRKLIPFDVSVPLGTHDTNVSKFELHQTFRWNVAGIHYYSATHQMSLRDMRERFIVAE